MNKTALLIIAIAILVGIGIITVGKSDNNPTSNTTQSAQNVEVRDGIQYITINARGGYSPKLSLAKSNIPTKLIVKTDGTYDCSASLVIRSIGYRKVLPRTGEETIDLGTPQEGTLRGLCSMGMYSFAVDFE